MSEHQVYEFLAIDRPLTDAQMRELRAISTRADISSTRFWNEYEWGNLKADPLQLMVDYFDLHVYFANWGAHRICLRVPAARLNLADLEPYFVAHSPAMKKAGAFVVFDFHDLLEGPEDDGEGASSGAFTALRTELMQGDLRLPYLAWLMAVQQGELADDEEEPPVPPGLSSLTACQQAFVEFLHLDVDLIAVAAEASQAERFDDKGFRAWVKGLSVGAKTAWLLRPLDDPGLLLGAELRRAFLLEAKDKAAQAGETVPARRTVAELRAGVTGQCEAREKAEREAEERRQKKVAADRKLVLDELAKREPAAWTELETMIEESRYDAAVKLALDLRDLAAREKHQGSFIGKLEALRKRQSRKRGFFDRWKRATEPRSW